VFRVLPPFGGEPRAVAEILNGVMNGKTNNTGTITLNTGNATTTSLIDERISIDTKIVLIPFSDAAETDTAPYGAFSNNNDQTAPSTGTTAVVEFDTTEESNGVYLDDDTKIYVRNPGIYNCQYSLQLVNYANSIEYADVWFRINGNDVDRSASRFDVQARKSAGVPNHLIGSMNIFLDLNAGDYIEIAGAVSSTDVQLEHLAADVVIPRPSIPAVIFTVQYIAPYAYSNVYVESQTKGSAIISHFANNTADKTYAYILVG
jgi:hypothetical protein